MPLRLFWSAARHTDRIAAWNDKRALDVALSAQSAQGGDGWREFHSSLAEAAGITMEPVLEVSSKDEILKFVGAYK